MPAWAYLLKYCLIFRSIFIESASNILWNSMIFCKMQNIMQISEYSANTEQQKILGQYAEIREADP